MQSEVVDTTAFESWPLLRPDELGTLPADVLRASVADLELMCGQVIGGSEDAIAEYATRQRQRTLSILSERAAQDRVQALLAGTTCTAAPLDTANGKSSTMIAFSARNLSANASIAPSFDDRSIINSDRPNTNDYNRHLGGIHHQPSPPFADPPVAGRNHANSPYLSPANIQPGKHSTEGTAPGTQTKSLHKAPSLEVRRHNNRSNVLSAVPEPSNSTSGVPETDCGGASGILGSTENTNQGTKWKLDSRDRRSPSFNSVVHEKWGSVFVVGGGQRRRRPPVRNRSTGLDDTPAARKAQVEKERQERRKASLGRLLARKEHRSRQQAARRKRKAIAAQVTAAAKSASPTGFADAVPRTSPRGRRRPRTPTSTDTIEGDGVDQPGPFRPSTPVLSLRPPPCPLVGESFGSTQEGDRDGWRKVTVGRGVDVTPDVSRDINSPTASDQGEDKLVVVAETSTLLPVYDVTRPRIRGGKGHVEVSKTVDMGMCASGNSSSESESVSGGGSSDGDLSMEETEPLARVTDSNETTGARNLPSSNQQNVGGQTERTAGVLKHDEGGLRDEWKGQRDDVGYGQGTGQLSSRETEGIVQRHAQRGGLVVGNENNGLTSPFDRERDRGSCSNNYASGMESIPNSEARGRFQTQNNSDYTEEAVGWVHSRSQEETERHEGQAAGEVIDHAIHGLRDSSEGGSGRALAIKAGEGPNRISRPTASPDAVRAIGELSYRSRAHTIEDSRYHEADDERSLVRSTHRDVSRKKEETLAFANDVSRSICATKKSFMGGTCSSAERESDVDSDAGDYTIDIDEGRELPGPLDVNPLPLSMDPAVAAADKVFTRTDMPSNSFRTHVPDSKRNRSKLGCTATPPQPPLLQVSRKAMREQEGMLHAPAFCSPVRATCFPVSAIRETSITPRVAPTLSPEGMCKDSDFPTSHTIERAPAVSDAVHGDRGIQQPARSLPISAAPLALREDNQTPNRDDMVDEMASEEMVRAIPSSKRLVESSANIRQHDENAPTSPAWSTTGKEKRSSRQDAMTKAGTVNQDSGEYFKEPSTSRSEKSILDCSRERSAQRSTETPLLATGRRCSSYIRPTPMSDDGSRRSIANYTDVFSRFAAILSAHHNGRALTRDADCRSLPLTSSIMSSGGLGGGRTGRGLGLNAVEEQACMHWQWKMYAIYVRVIKDYAAVFSYGDGWPTNGQEDASSLVYSGDPSALHYRVNSKARPEVYNIVTDVLNNRCEQWEELPTGLGLKTTWNLLWTWSKPHIQYSSLLFWQKVNHFPNSRELTRKDLLNKHISRFMAPGGRLAREFHIMPQTFVLPHEFTNFVAAFTSQGRSRQARDKRPDTSNGGSSEIFDGAGGGGGAGEDWEEDDCAGDSRRGGGGRAGKNVWIMKPVGMSRGRGIRLIDDIKNISYAEKVVVQRYIGNPLLLDGYKFDLRLYVLVTSFNRLEAFIYKEGFARVSTHRYEKGDIENRFIHLTNSSIQRLNDSGATRDSPLHSANISEAGGTKVTLSYLWRRLAASGVDVGALWANICSVVVKSLVCVEGSIPNQPNSGGWTLQQIPFGCDSYHDMQIRQRRVINVTRAKECHNDVVPHTLSMSDVGPFGMEMLLLSREHGSVGVMCLQSLETLVKGVTFSPDAQTTDCIWVTVFGFELYGYDVLIDERLRPWLIEVNSSPSMAREHHVDRQVKEAVIFDAVHLVDPLPFDRQKLVDILERRLSETDKSKARPFQQRLHTTEHRDQRNCSAPTLGNGKDMRGSTCGDRPRQSKDEEELDKDLNKILCGRRPRKVGELPHRIGNFVRLCPGTAAHRRATRLRKKVIRPLPGEDDSKADA